MLLISESEGRSSPADALPGWQRVLGILETRFTQCRGTLGLELVIGECVLDSQLNLGAALVVGEARRCYLVVISV